MQELPFDGPHRCDLIRLIGEKPSVGIPILLHIRKAHKSKRTLEPVWSSWMEFLLNCDLPSPADEYCIWGMLNIIANLDVVGHISTESNASKMLNTCDSIDQHIDRFLVDLSLSAAGHSFLCRQRYE